MAYSILFRNNMTIRHKKITFSLILISCLALIPLSQSRAEISLKSVTYDISYLASDKLKGRANFSKEIDQAADYISQRFNQIGLLPMAGNQGFQQTFSIFNIKPTSLTLSLNNTPLDANNLAMVSTMTNFSWQQVDAVKTHIVGENDNFRDKLAALNQQGGQHLILLHPSHQALFKRYQRYFQRGSYKLKLAHQGTIVIALTETNQLTSLQVTGSSTIKKQRLTNVVGILPGKSKPEEIVIYSAHYDHLGELPEAESSEGENSDDESQSDVIYNGANDDASGTTAIINLAQHFARQQDNARTLMFSAFTAEEIGGFGSRAFSQQLIPEKVVAMINIEMIGKPSKFGAGTVWMTGMERSNLGDLLNKQIIEQKHKIHQDPYPEQGLFYRSDNATLARLGVPAHSFSSTQLDDDQDYHQVSDDLASLDLDSMYKVIKTLAIGTQGLVDGSVTPSRIDVTQVTGHGLLY